MFVLRSASTEEEADGIRDEYCTNLCVIVSHKWSITQKETSADGDVFKVRNNEQVSKTSSDCSNHASKRQKCMYHLRKSIQKKDNYICYKSTSKGQQMTTEFGRDCSEEFSKSSSKNSQDEYRIKKNFQSNPAERQVKNIAIAKHRVQGPRIITSSSRPAIVKERKKTRNGPRKFNIAVKVHLCQFNDQQRVKKNYFACKEGMEEGTCRDNFTSRILKITNRSNHRNKSTSRRRVTLLTFASTRTVSHRDSLPQVKDVDESAKLSSHRSNA
ncbi:unnamed protein product [Caenorhabditis brenneri]